MDSDEIKNFIKLWIIAFTSLTYTYHVSSKLPKGKFRFISLLPIFYLFTTLPLQLTTISLGGFSTMFLTFLCNFKLLLFSFGQGPLTFDPSISLPNFISIACLPIKIKQNPDKSNPKTPKLSLLFALKVLLLGFLILVYEQKDQIHPQIMLIYNCVSLYVYMELPLSVFQAMVVLILGFELEPQFNEPYLATSLQDFWGRRWNLLVPNLLRPVVYDPVHRISTRMLDRRWVPVVGVLATFVLSGLVHEVVFFYLGRVKPTWEVTCFFLLQGLCVVVEILVKRAVKDTWQLHRLVSGPLTLAFVMVTAVWLFFPPLLRCGMEDRAYREFGAFLGLVRNFGSA